MKPTKTAAKKPAKRKRNPNDLGNPMIGKLLDLKYRINDVYQLVKDGNGKPKFDLTILGDTRLDKQWVMGQISALREGARLDTHQMEKANEIWRKYS